VLFLPWLLYHKWSVSDVFKDVIFKRNETLLNAFNCFFAVHLPLHVVLENLLPMTITIHI
jgi:hypothetical protein